MAAYGVQSKFTPLHRRNSAPSPKKKRKVAGIGGKANIDPMTESPGRKTIVVGASGGMGGAVAARQARQGDKLALVGRNLEKLSQVADGFPDLSERPELLAVDLGDMDACTECIREAAELMGGIDSLIFCSGVHVRAKTQEADLERWDKALDVNFRSFVHLVRAAIDSINASGHGAVIAIGSITSAYSGAALNVAAKRALTGFCEVLFEDVRDFGTKVCVIQPGFVATSMSASPRLEADLMIQPTDIAEAVGFVLRTAPTACPTEIVIRPQRSPFKK